MSADLAHSANARNAPEREHRSSAPERRAVAPWATYRTAPLRSLTGRGLPRGTTDPVCLRDVTRGVRRAPAPARTCQNQVRGWPQRPIRAPRTCCSTRVTGAARPSPGMLPIGCNGHPVGCFEDRPGSPVSAVRPVSCSSPGYGTQLARLSSDSPPTWANSVSALTCGRSWSTTHRRCSCAATGARTVRPRPNSADGRSKWLIGFQLTWPWGPSTTRWNACRASSRAWSPPPL
jgi:hypothetical protein